jgi:hypothetical protein
LPDLCSAAEAAAAACTIANYNRCRTLRRTNYFALNPKALYEIRIDNDGDAQPT